MQTTLAANPFGGHGFAFHGRRGGILKMLWFDGQRLLLLAKRLERGRLAWPQADSGSCDTLAGAAVDAAGRHRLANAAAHRCTAAGRVTYWLTPHPGQP
ncbi:IS66 family insertion sequence element accessory protein TnpB [Ramlibacter sp.]|uniref:IS66 family insertion sequence element accessory protein TnpB n=1 Tax=Ramlibacter sp. TaxID=1917967 RepID=UPI00345C8285